MSFSETESGKHLILAKDPKGLLPSPLAKRWQNSPRRMDYSPKTLGVSVLKDWEPPQSNEALDHTTPFESKVLGFNLGHRAKTYHSSGHVRINTMSALTRYSRRVLESSSMLESRKPGPRSPSATKWKFLIPSHRLTLLYLTKDAWPRSAGRERAGERLPCRPIRFWYDVDAVDIEGQYILDFNHESKEVLMYFG